MGLLRFTRDAGTDASAGAGAAIPFTAVTGGLKADGIDTAKLPWDFSRGRTVDGGWVRYPMLWVHDMSSVPLGAVDVRMSDDGQTMRAMAYFDPEDPEALRVERKYRSDVGGMFGFSAQWDDVDPSGLPARRTGNKATAHQLLEVSAVPVPLDPEAVKDGYALAGMRALRSQLDAVLGDTEPAPEVLAEPAAVKPVKARRSIEGSYEEIGEDVVEAIQAAGYFGKSYMYLNGTFSNAVVVTVCDGNGNDKEWKIEYTVDSNDVVTLGNMTEVEVMEVVGPLDGRSAAPSADEELWRSAAAEMVSAFTRGSGDSDDERRRAYRVLLPTYRHLGKEAPEWIDGAELDALDDDNWRALFVAGELAAQARAGAELSARNVADLRTALDSMETACGTIRGMIERVTGTEKGPNMLGHTGGDSVRSFVDELAIALAELANA